MLRHVYHQLPARKPVYFVVYNIAIDCLACVLLICSNAELTRENEEWRKR